MHKAPEVVQDTYKYSGILRPGKISQKSIIKEGIYLKKLFYLNSRYCMSGLGLFRFSQRRIRVIDVKGNSNLGKKRGRVDTLSMPLGSISFRQRS